MGRSAKLHKRVKTDSKVKSKLIGPSAAATATPPIVPPPIKRHIDLQSKHDQPNGPRKKVKKRETRAPPPPRHRARVATEEGILRSTTGAGTSGSGGGGGGRGGGQDEKSSLDAHSADNRHVLKNVDYIDLMMGGRRKAKLEAEKLMQID